MDTCYLPRTLLTSNQNSLYVAKSNIPQSLNLLIAKIACYAPVKAMESTENFDSARISAENEDSDVVITKDFENVNNAATTATDDKKMQNDIATLVMNKETEVDAEEFVDCLELMNYLRERIMEQWIGKVNNKSNEYSFKCFRL